MDMDVAGRLNPREIMDFSEMHPEYSKMEHRDAVREKCPSLVAEFCGANRTPRSRQTTIAPTPRWSGRVESRLLVAHVARTRHRFFSPTRKTQCCRTDSMDCPTSEPAGTESASRYWPARICHRRRRTAAILLRHHP